MDAFSLMFFRLDFLTERIKAIYTYIFKFFLTGVPDDDTDEDKKHIGKQNSIRI